MKIETVVRTHCFRRTVSSYRILQCTKSCNVYFASYGCEEIPGAMLFNEIIVFGHLILRIVNYETTGKSLVLCTRRQITCENVYSPADWCRNCGIYGKSTKFCTKIENYLLNNISYGPTWDLSHNCNYNGFLYFNHGNEAAELFVYFQQSETMYQEKLIN